MRKIIYIAILLLSVFSCNKVEKKIEVSNTPVINKQITSHSPNMAEGFTLLEKSCFSCHSANAAVKSNIAPTMASLKQHYIKPNTTQEQFAKDVYVFVNNPSEAISKMPEAIEKYNLMPKMKFSEEEVSKMAAYLYNTEIENPNWFDEHYNKDKQKFSAIATENKTPIEVGKSFAMQTKSTLGKNLLAAINTKGTENAVAFCSTRAIPLTDSVALALNATIKRVSDKNRNPNNKANEQELAYINSAKEQLNKKLPVKPALIETKNKHIGYYPIITNEMCMQCHGQPNVDINDNILAKINSLYPNDLATGYLENELRGIWVVEMNAN